jgi:hypothetical protein
LKALDFLDGRGNDLPDISHDTGIGELENLCIRIPVDRCDTPGFSHAHRMLDSTGNTAGHIQFGADGLAGLARLVVMGDPADHHRQSAGGHARIQSMGQIRDAAKGLLVSYTHADGNENSNESHLI